MIGQVLTSGIARVKDARQRGLRYTILLLFVWCSGAVGQPYYFEVLDDHQSWSERSTNTILLNDSIYWCNAGYDFVSGQGTHLSFLKLNNQGEVLRKVVHAQVDGRFETGHVTAYGDSGILCLTSFKPDGDNWFDHRLTAFDTLGNILWEHVYPDSGFTETAYDIQKVSSGGYLLIGQRYDSDDGDMVALKVDDQGLLLWKKTYGGSSYESGNSFVETPDGGFLLFGWTRSYGAGQRDFYLVKTDADGNQQWQKTYGTSGEEGGANIIRLADGNYLLTGSGSMGSSVSIGRQYKVTPNGTVIWSETYSYDNNTGHNLHETVEMWDGDLVSVGMTNDFSNAGYLIRTNSEGQLIWQREYDKNAATDLFYSLLATVDGGFLLSGQAINLDNSSQDAWLLKVDSIGCPYPNCTVGIDEVDKKVMFDVWPNPCTDVLNIALADASTPLQITVLDLNGREMLKHVQHHAQGTIDVSAWPNGIYVLSGLDGNGRSISVKLMKLH